MHYSTYAVSCISWLLWNIVNVNFSSKSTWHWAIKTFRSIRWDRPFIQISTATKSVSNGLGLSADWISSCLKAFGSKFESHRDIVHRLYFRFISISLLINVRLPTIYFMAVDVTETPAISTMPLDHGLWLSRKSETRVPLNVTIHQCGNFGTLPNYRVGKFIYDLASRFSLFIAGLV